MINKSILWIREDYLYLVIFVSFVATFGSLILGVKYNPCELCWYQRIFMYGIFAVSLIGAVIKDSNNTHKYIVGLATPGIIIAIYNYFIQIFPSSTIFQCSISNPCTKIDFMLFGFLTIPLMSAMAFLSILIICGIKINKSKDGKNEVKV